MSPLTIYQATGFRARFYGWQRFDNKNAVLYFPNCRAIHTFGLSQGVWLLFLDKESKPIASWRYVAGHRVAWLRQATAVIEAGISSSALQRRQLWHALQQQGLNQLEVENWLGFARKHCDKSDINSCTKQP